MSRGLQFRVGVKRNMDSILNSCPVDNLWINRPTPQVTRGLVQAMRIFWRCAKDGDNGPHALAESIAPWQPEDADGFVKIPPHGKKESQSLAAMQLLRGLVRARTRSGSTLAASATISSERSPTTPSL